MSDAPITVKQFRDLAEKELAFLDSKGFRRAPHLENSLPTDGSIIYLGRHVGFNFSFDLRDQCVDAYVMKVQDGQIKRNWEGGYSSGVFEHLVKHAGYRGGTISSVDRNGPLLERMISGWVDMLIQAGQKLLEDKPDSLP